MLNRYETWDGYRFIPWTENRFLLSVSGDVIDVQSGEKTSSGKNSLIEIFNGKNYVSCKRSVLVALVSKQSWIPQDLWDQLDTIAIDGDDDNTHANNLIWKFPDDGLRVKEFINFAYVPGFTRYAISKEGIVYSHASKKIISPYQDEMGYWMYGCQPDVGKRTIIGRHRLLGLAYLQYPANVDNLDVNHKDGIKTNCELVNLEWGTRKHNCDHAYSTGLRTDNIEVSVRNVITNEIRDYYSFEDCGRQLDYHGKTIRLRVASAGQIVYPPGLQFRRKDDPTEWKDVDDPVAALIRAGVPRGVGIVNMLSGEKHTFKSIVACARFLDIKHATLRASLKYRAGKPIGNFLVTYNFDTHQKQSLTGL